MTDTTIVPAPPQSTSDDKPSEPRPWIDVQRGLAWLLIGVFVFAIVVLEFRVVWNLDASTIIDLLKTLTTALINIVMVVVGYFFGSSKGSQAKDDSSAKITDRLANAVIPPTTK